MPPKKACRFGFKPSENKFKKDKCAFCGLTEAEHGASDSPEKKTAEPSAEQPTASKPTAAKDAASAPVVTTAASADIANSTAAPDDATSSSSTTTSSTDTATASSSPSKSGKKACKFGFKPHPNKYKKDTCATCGLSEAAHAEVQAELAAKRAKEEAEAKAWTEQQAVRKAQEEEEYKKREEARIQEQKEKKAQEELAMQKVRERLAAQEAERKAEEQAIYAALRKGEEPPKRKAKPLKQYEILDWAIEIAARFGVNVVSFTNPSWKDGMAFAALVANFRPDLLDVTKLDPTQGDKNCQLALEALGKAGVSIYLDPEDVKDADDKSIATQVFGVYSYYWKNPHLPVDSPPKVKGGVAGK